MLGPLVSMFAFAVIGGVISSTLLLSFKSTASVELALTLPEFKVIAQRLSSASTFETYAAHAKDVAAKASSRNVDELTQRLDSLQEWVTSPAKQSKWIEPIYRLSKLDLKEVGDTTKVNADLIGYTVSKSAKNAAEAQAQTALLADYVADSNVRELLLARHESSVAKQKAAANEAAAQKATNLYNVSMLEKRLEQLRRISKAYPQVNESTSRQVISLEKGGERYMPLPSQMAAVETEMMDIAEGIARTERSLLQSKTEGDMLQAHETLVRASLSGRQLLVALLADIEPRIANATEEHDKLLFLGYFNSLNEIKVKYLDLPRFIVAPQLPEKPTRSPWLMTIMMGLLGLLIGLGIEFRSQLKTVFKTLLSDEESLSRQAISHTTPIGGQPLAIDDLRRSV